MTATYLHSHLEKVPSLNKSMQVFPMNIVDFRKSGQSVFSTRPDCSRRRTPVYWVTWMAARDLPLSNELHRRPHQRVFSRVQHGRVNGHLASAWPRHRIPDMTGNDISTIHSSQITPGKFPNKAWTIMSSAIENNTLCWLQYSGQSALERSQWKLCNGPPHSWNSANKDIPNTIINLIG